MQNVVAMSPSISVLHFLFLTAIIKVVCAYNFSKTYLLDQLYALWTEYWAVNKYYILMMSVGKIWFKLRNSFKNKGGPDW